MGILRLTAPLVLTALTVFIVDRSMLRRKLLPPLFRADQAGSELVARMRRGFAAACLAGVFYLAVFSPISLVGQTVEPDLSEVGTAQLFIVHAILALVLTLWYVAGYVPRPARGGWWDEFGLRAHNLGREILIGGVAGAGIWLAVIVLLLFLVGLITLLGGAETLPQSPPSVVLWMAGLPAAVRVLVALSAGFFEEVFFRGFLQPRIGVALSTVLFTLAHLSYQQPFMLVGVAVLSIFFAMLVRWRQSIWAAITAHAVFDLVQLLVILPMGARALNS
ncbi:MAG: type II CAAX endopeptidase family protein [Acidobacteriota bacterium]|nr:type II CAAX endopeptidase family protein [Acidobacteriota bacterium]